MTHIYDHTTRKVTLLSTSISCEGASHEIDQLLADTEKGPATSGCLGFSSQRRHQAMLMAMRQKRSLKSWSPVCWRQLKMCAGLPRNTSGEKRPGGGMWLSTVQSRKTTNRGDAGKPGGMVGARRNIRRSSASSNMLSIWQNPRLNKKSWKILQLAALTKWDVKTWISKPRILSAMTPESCAGIWDLIKDIIHFILTEWEESTIVFLYKGKGVTLERGNYRGLIFLDQDMEAREKVAENVVRQEMRVNDMQFGSMPGWNTKTPYSSYKSSMPSTRHCTWPLWIRKRH